MPHPRIRHALERFSQLMRFNRVVTIQGCRQSGKSFFARELIKLKFKELSVVSLDSKTEKDFANSNPESFLVDHEGDPLVIDEAQKAPDLFDAIKLKVDLDSRPGQFVLLGSTEFSKELKIRESLTGRLARMRFFTFNLKETNNIPLATSKEAFALDLKTPVSRAALLKHLKCGGFPSIFHLRDMVQRRSMIQDWMKLVVYRDMTMFPGIKVDTELAMNILAALPLLEEPNASSLASKLKKNSKVIQKHLNLFEILFVVHRLNPHPTGTGKPYYFLADVSLADYFGADFERKLWTWSLHEILAKRSYLVSNDYTPLYYYRNSKGSLVHLLEEQPAKKSVSLLKILPDEKFDLRDFEILKAYKVKNKPLFKHIDTRCLGHQSLDLKNEKIRIHSFETMG